MSQKYVFISYSSHNRRSANEVKTVLESNGISCWMDLNGIPGGGDFGTEISKAIDGCSVFILLISKESQKSEWVPKELDYAISSSKPIIPLCIDSKPLTKFRLHLANVQCINVYGNKESAYEMLVAQIFRIWNEKPVLPFSLPLQKKSPVGKQLLFLAAVICALALLIISILSLHEHAWESATCISPMTCTICGKTSGSTAAHDWQVATCTTPKTCTVCGETSGSTVPHNWLEATCVDPKTCSVCGETSGSAAAHDWQMATCTLPKTCSECGATDGFALGHLWIDATYDAPKTCSRCEKTEGTALVKKTVYINDLPVHKKYGKLWLMGGTQPSGTVHTVINEKEAYDDYMTLGYTLGPVYDHRGNQYDRGWFVDGNEFSEYYVEYNLGEKYTTFSFTYAMTSDLIGSPVALNKKQFLIYGDGELLFESNKMSENGYPQSVTISVEGVKTLRIVYPKTPSPSRICAIFDGIFS